MKAVIGRVLGLAALMTLVASSALAYGGAVAIVFNPQTQSYGSFHGADGRIGAESSALAECGANCNGVDAYGVENGFDGIRETWAINGWVALAFGSDGAFGTSGQHGSQYAAEESAIENCGGYEKNCYVVRSVSSYTDGPDFDGTRTN